MSANYALPRQFAFYVMECVSCGVTFGVPEEFDLGRRINRERFFCPNGHGQSYSESEADRLRRKLEAAKRDVEWQKSRVASMDKQLIAQRGVVTKLKKRIGAGVCPCCHRTFKQLAAHMAGQHPDYAEKPVAEKGRP